MLIDAGKGFPLRDEEAASMSAIAFAYIAVDLHAKAHWWQLHGLLVISGMPAGHHMQPARFLAVTRGRRRQPSAELPLPPDRRTSTLFSLRRTSGQGAKGRA